MKKIFSVIDGPKMYEIIDALEDCYRNRFVESKVHFKIAVTDDSRGPDTLISINMESVRVTGVSYSHSTSVTVVGECTVKRSYKSGLINKNRQRFEAKYNPDVQRGTVTFAAI